MELLTGASGSYLAWLLPASPTHLTLLSRYSVHPVTLDMGLSSFLLTHH